MKIAVLGGTGRMGWAIARLFSRKHQVFIGSRDPARAREAAKTIPGAAGMDYLSASRQCDVAVFALPYSALAEARPLAEALAGKLVVSTMNPMRVEDGVLRYGLDDGSAAEGLAGLLPKSRVVTGFNNMPPLMVQAAGDTDILVAASSKEAFDEAAKLFTGVGGFRPLYAGPLSEAQSIERVTTLVLNLGKWNGTGRLAPKFVSGKK